MLHGQLQRHDHDLDKNFRPRRAREFVERGACYARSWCCSVVPSAVAIYLFVQPFVMNTNC
jgi:hypothetical protein